MSGPEFPIMSTYSPSQQSPTRPGLRGMSVGARILFAASISFLIIGFCAFKMWRNLNLLADTQHWVAHTNKVVATTNLALAALVDMETGSRGFAVGGQVTFLEPYEAGKTAFAKAIDTAKIWSRIIPPRLDASKNLLTHPPCG